jgi:CHAT domain-containing protein
MDSGDFLTRLLLDPASLPALIVSLSDSDIASIVERLKREADRHWAINANRSLEMADLIIAIGETRGDRCHIALGMMARGDALKLLGCTEAAWQALERAGELFRECGEEIGWARTRIGRLAICVDLNHVDEALSDADRARDIFTRHGVHDRRLVLDLNTAVVYDLLGDYQRALALYHSALGAAEELGESGQKWIGPLHTNMGFAYEALGNLPQALAVHERACAIFAALGETKHMAVTETNIAIIAMKQGHYRRALNILYRTCELYVAEHLPRDAAEVQRIIVECYLLLNRYSEARDLVQQVIVAFRTFGAAYEEALALLHLASAEAELSNPDAALAALDEAERVFASLDAPTWSATTRLRRGRIALEQGDIATAQHETAAAAACFLSGGQPVMYATATMLQGQAAFAAHDLDGAVHSAAAALRIAQQANVPPLRYTGHLLLGRVAEAAGDDTRAMRRYQAAAALVERVQRGLTMTLRPGFLEDKDEAQRALIALYLRNGRPERAFECLERAKSQVLFSHLANREQLRWVYDDPRSRELIEELDQLREEHQWFYGIAHDQPGDPESHPGSYTSEQALLEVSNRERRMRAITEQLYLRGGEQNVVNQVAVPPLPDVQRCLDEETLLVEFYNDGGQLWAFALDRSSLTIHALPTTVRKVDQLLAQLQLNLASALRAGPEARLTHNLARVVPQILQRLHAVLLAPLAQRLRRRLLIVPYGALHYLPFHLLHDGAKHLIEQHEVVVLPAASLATRRGPQRRPGALVLAHSLNGHLPQTMAEARMVQRLFGGQIYCDQAARRTALQAPPAQILHIAAHGEHRLDQPDLSYIQLADGQLYADDLVQQDLSYELVTLSACETGRATVAAGDELIGIGRRVLYAGAGALVVSLWPVFDESAVVLMEHMYRSLRNGASKSAALGDAQRAALHGTQQLHPAFWGAFQLIGDASPLSIVSASVVKKESLYDSVPAAT